MAEMTPIVMLTHYFNKDSDGKSIKPVSEWNAELKALTPAEKRELAELAAAATGNTLK